MKIDKQHYKDTRKYLQQYLTLLEDIAHTYGRSCTICKNISNKIISVDNLLLEMKHNLSKKKEKEQGRS